MREITRITQTGVGMEIIFSDGDERILTNEDQQEIARNLDPRTFPLDVFDAISAGRAR